jgi:hypothetical protein
MCPGSLIPVPWERRPTLNESLANPQGPWVAWLGDRPIAAGWSAADVAVGSAAGGRLRDLSASLEIALRGAGGGGPLSSQLPSSTPAMLDMVETLRRLPVRSRADGKAAEGDADVSTATWAMVRWALEPWDHLTVRPTDNEVDEPGLPIGLCARHRSPCAPGVHCQKCDAGCAVVFSPMAPHSFPKEKTHRGP